MINSQQIEQAIEEVASAGPRITKADIDKVIESEWYINAGQAVKPDADGYITPPVPDPHPLRLLTFCVLVLKNGYTVTGESACVSAENFNEEIGRSVARDNAFNKIWALEGYLLKERLFNLEKTI
jgi:hypothetical protein